MNVTYLWTTVLIYTDCGSDGRFHKEAVVDISEAGEKTSGCLNKELFVQSERGNAI